MSNQSRIHVQKMWLSAIKGMRLSTDAKQTIKFSKKVVAMRTRKMDVIGDRKIGTPKLRWSDDDVIRKDMSETWVRGEEKLGAPIQNREKAKEILYRHRYASLEIFCNGNIDEWGTRLQYVSPHHILLLGIYKGIKEHLSRNYKSSSYCRFASCPVGGGHHPTQ